MKKKNNGIIERLCNYLGRQNFVSKYLDYLANFMFPTSEYAYGGEKALSSHSLPDKDKVEDALSKPMLMARPPAGLEMFMGNAPTTPAETHGFEVPGIWHWLFSSSAEHSREKTSARASQTHSAAACADPKYRGMHGRPCLFAGGTDNRCPTGTVSGWYWSYEVSGLGRIYYVDCCGGATASDVWCNWSVEQNWCFGHGRAQAAGRTAYTCTLAILEADLNVVSNGSGGFIVDGVDP